MRSPLLSSALSLLLLAAAACDAGLDTNPGDEPGPEVTCQVTAGSHEGACQAGACTVSEDVILGCDTPDAFRDFTLAPAPDGVWFALAGDEASAVLRIADGAATSRSTGLSTGADVMLAIDGAGRAHYASLVIDEGEYTTEYAVFDGAAWQPTTLASWGPHGLEIGADEEPVLWAQGPEYEGTDVYAGGSLEPANVEDFGGAAQYTLGADGEPVRFLVDDLSSEVVATTNGEPLTIYQGGILPPEEVGLAHPPAPWPATNVGPRVAALMDDSRLEDGSTWTGGLYVAFADDASMEPILLPDSHLPNGDCPDYTDFDEEFSMCDSLGECSSDGLGVRQWQWAIARTNDGLLWVAMVQTHVVTTGTYAEVCYDDEYCECAVEITSDTSTHELQLFRVDPATREVVLAMRLPVDESDYQGVAMRGYGTSLAIGLRTLGSGDERVVRVLRVETGG